MKCWLLFLSTVIHMSITAQTVDSMAIKQVDSLIKVSRDFTAKEDFDKAIEVNAVAEKIALEKLGKLSATYGSCVFNRGRVNHHKGDYPEAEVWYLRSQSILEKALGKKDPNYASSLNNLGVLYMHMGNYKKAEPFYVEAKEIREKVLGKEHPEYANSLDNLGILYRHMGNYEKAEPLYVEAKEIREKVLGKENPEYADGLNNLAILYNNMGKYEKAETLYFDAKDIFRKAFGKEHPAYATSLNNLAHLYLNMGNYEKAEPLYLEAKDIFGKALGKEHPNYAKSLNSLAILYLNMGNYEKAEPLYLEAKDIFGKALGKEHSNYAASLLSLGILYRNMGNYEKAEPLYLEAIAIQEKILGKEHPEYANSLNNLATLYHNMGNYIKAEPLYLEVKDKWGKVLGKEHPDYAMSLNNLGSLYYNMGNYIKAEPLYLEAKDIWGKVLGKEHPDYATNLNNIAQLYMDLGNYVKAEPLYLEAKDIREKALGKEHPDYAKSLIGLADLYEKQNLFSLSEPLLKETYALSQTRLVKATSFLSEKELSQYMATFQNIGGRLSSYLFARLISERQTGILNSLAFDHALFYKGFLLMAATQLHAPALVSTESAEINLRLKGYRRRLAREYAKPIAERKGVAELEEKANLAEKELARSVAGYSEALRQVKWGEVKTILKPSEVAIEFVHFKFNFPKKTDSTMYAALLILPDSEQAKFIPLFEEKSLDSLLNSKAERKADYVNGLYSLADRGASSVDASKRSLYDILWKPLEKELSGIKTIYFSPSGLLHRINLDAIPISETETLADKYKLIELISTRQLVIPTQIKNINNDAVLYGGIQFEQDTSFRSNEPIIASRSRGELSFSSIDSTLRGGTWNYLAGTEREVNAIEKIMQASGVKTNMKKGYAATEESFKNIGSNNNSSPRILHIATHGYFFSDPKSTTTTNGFDNQKESVFKMSDHPMLRSGLIMAGGNAAWHGEPTLEGREDGVLTAYEISQMNLSNTELVVLSACETGLGDIQGNEGVYGLQRAFKIAGAKYLIMSLWQVPDKQTSLLMTTFYKKWLEEKMSIPNAFHAAQKQLRDGGLEPYYWAGFVLVE